jgi:hypothetical protein
MGETTDKNTQPATSDRAGIAKWVIGGAAGCLLGLTVALIYSDSAEGSKTAFTMLVPLIGTWVGTVLAYYFSGDNFERASNSVSKLVDQVLLDKLKSIPVKEAMIAKGIMKCVELPAGDDGSKVNLKEKLIDLFKAPITRLPVLDSSGAVKHVIHQSLVYRFVTERTIEMAAQQKTFDIAAQTLKDFLDYGDMRDAVTKSMAFVRADASLADAKAKMEGTTGCQDVFITDDANPDKPVLGWLTNVEIAKRAKL